MVQSARHAVACLLLALLAAAALPGCQTNPATGQSQLNFISPAREAAMGAELAPEFTQTNGGQLQNGPINRYVTQLGRRLAAVSELPELPWEFTVLDSAQVNAFALPGGKVFVSRGLLAALNNEAQLAGVIGHEIGHVTARHSSRRLTQNMIVQGVAISAALAGAATEEDWLTWAGVGTSAAGGLYLLSFSRDQELEADTLGVRYMSKLGYDPDALVSVMEIFLQMRGGQGNKLQEFFATHPNPESRIDQLRDLLKSGKYAIVGGELHAEQYRQNVLEPLKALPPPTQAQQRAAEALMREVREHVVGCAGCDRPHGAAS
jgi:predicted Zn-dependent protease